jgi:hypothetical protein
MIRKITFLNFTGNKKNREANACSDQLLAFKLFFCVSHKMARYRKNDMKHILH